MVIVSVSGEEGCAHQELAGLIAQSLPAELITEAGLRRLIEAEFPAVDIPDKAWRFAVELILVKMAAKQHLVVCAPHVSAAIQELHNRLRVHLIGARRGRPGSFDLVLNAGLFTTSQMLEIVETSLRTKGLTEQGALPSMAQSEFNARLKLARHGIAPLQEGRGPLSQFTHPSEQMFANLLDFYRIRWEYEPRSFPLQWDKDGKVLEAFTPDFYLPEFDMYVELTTMKQSLVTKKNRKVRLLKTIYPHVNIQVFYQKDFQELVSKYGMAE